MHSCLVSWSNSRLYVLCHWRRVSMAVSPWERMGRAWDCTQQNVFCCFLRGGGVISTKWQHLPTFFLIWMIYYCIFTKDFKDFCSDTFLLNYRYGNHVHTSMTGKKKIIGKNQTMEKILFKLRGNSESDRRWKKYVICEHAFILLKNKNVFHFIWFFSKR